MAETNQEDLEDLLASSGTLSNSDLDLSEDELAEVFETAEDEDAGTSDDFGLMEDFSLEGEGEAVAQEAPTLPHNLELLMDIELNVVIELGRTRRTIRDVLHFVPGSVIELNKMAGETVDVFINDRLIAKGEVILFEDSLGVRVTSITTKEDLIRQLGGQG